MTGAGGPELAQGARATMLPGRMRAFLRITSRLIEKIRINAVHQEIRDGRAFWVKRRRGTAGPILATANGFFRAVGSPTRAFQDPEAWLAWETHTFTMLHDAEGFTAGAEAPQTFWAETLPGVNLTVPLDAGTITPAMTAAAGRELRRAHACYSPLAERSWSHGDPHLGNFLYDARTDRARLIDFEVRHLRSISPDLCHADDLAAFLQDLAGRVQRPLWLPCAHAFLDTYDRPEILALAAPLLRLPDAPLPRLWWRIRTSFLPLRELAERLEALPAPREEPRIANSPGPIPMLSPRLS